MASPLISYILPFYRKFDWLSVVFPRNRCFYTEQAEVVLVLDEPTQETEVVAFVARQAARVRVLVNDTDHPWRPPCAALNVGLRWALGRYVVVLSPETYVLGEPDYLDYRVQDLAEHDILLGKMWQGVGITPQHTLAEIYRYVQAQPYSSDVYGFICGARQQLMAAGGYDEKRTRYGGDDDDLRCRLLAQGANWVNDPLIQVLHPYHPSVCREAPRESWGSLDLNFSSAGRSFDRIAFDYAHVAQLAEHRASNANVAGSFPVVCSTL